MASDSGQPRTVPRGEGPVLVGMRNSVATKAKASVAATAAPTAIAPAAVTAGAITTGVVSTVVVAMPVGSAASTVPAITTAVAARSAG